MDHAATPTPHMAAAAVDSRLTACRAAALQGDCDHHSGKSDVTEIHVASPFMLFCPFPEYSLHCSRL